MSRVKMALSKVVAASGSMMMAESGTPFLRAIIFIMAAFEVRPVKTSPERMSLGAQFP